MMNRTKFRTLCVALESRHSRSRRPPMRRCTASSRASPSRRRSTPRRRATRSSSNRGVPGEVGNAELRPAHQHREPAPDRQGGPGPGRGRQGPPRAHETQETGSLRGACGLRVRRVRRVRCPSTSSHGFYVRGFTVEDFPRNGIQTRFVDELRVHRQRVRAEPQQRHLPDRSRRTGWSGTTSPTARSTPRCGWRPPRTFASSTTMLYDSVIGFEITVSNNV